MKNAFDPKRGKNREKERERERERERDLDLDLDLFIDSLQYTHGKPWGKEREDPGNIQLIKQVNH